jgi:hypothetical protein
LNIIRYLDCLGCREVVINELIRESVIVRNVMSDKCVYVSEI